MPPSSDNHWKKETKQKNLDLADKQISIKHQNNESGQKCIIEF